MLLYYLRVCLMYTVCRVLYSTRSQRYIAKKRCEKKGRWRLPLCPHRPRSLPSDPGRPTRARWRFGEPACHPLTGAGRLHASGKPHTGAHADAHAHPGRTHMMRRPSSGGRDAARMAATTLERGALARDVVVVPQLRNSHDETRGESATNVHAASLSGTADPPIS